MNRPHPKDGIWDFVYQDSNIVGRSTVTSAISIDFVCVVGMIEHYDFALVVTFRVPLSRAERRVSFCGLHERPLHAARHQVMTQCLITLFCFGETTVYRVKGHKSATLLKVDSLVGSVLWIVFPVVAISFPKSASMSLACLKSSSSTLSFLAAFSENPSESGCIRNRFIYETRDGHRKRRTRFHRAAQPPRVLSTGADRKLRITPSAQLVNGRPSRMVPIEEALSQVRGDGHVGKNRASNLPRSVPIQPQLRGPGNGAANGSLNGAANGATASNGNRGTVASANLAARNGSLNQDSVRNVALSRSQGPPRYPSVVSSAQAVQLAAPLEPTVLSLGNEPIENELRVLPSDESFKWARDKYNKRERSIDVWSFVLMLRARLFLLDAKWSYLGGFSESKQVRSGVCTWWGIQSSW